MSLHSGLLDSVAVSLRLQLLTLTSSEGGIPINIQVQLDSGVAQLNAGQQEMPAGAFAVKFGTIHVYPLRLELSSQV